MSPSTLAIHGIVQPVPRCSKLLDCASIHLLSNEEPQRLTPLQAVQQSTKAELIK